jgi:hypothetical protein
MALLFPTQFEEFLFLVAFLSARPVLIVGSHNHHQTHISYSTMTTTTMTYNTIRYHPQLKYPQLV